MNRASNGQPKAYRRYTTGAYRQTVLCFLSFVSLLMVYNCNLLKEVSTLASSHSWIYLVNLGCQQSPLFCSHTLATHASLTVAIVNTLEKPPSQGYISAPTILPKFHPPFIVHLETSSIVKSSFLLLIAFDMPTSYPSLTPLEHHLPSSSPIVSWNHPFSKGFPLSHEFLIPYSKKSLIKSR